MLAAHRPTSSWQQLPPPVLPNVTTKHVSNITKGRGKVPLRTPRDNKPHKCKILWVKQNVDFSQTSLSGVTAKFFRTGTSDSSNLDGSKYPFIQHSILLLFFLRIHHHLESVKLWTDILWKGLQTNPEPFLPLGSLNLCGLYIGCWHKMGALLCPMGLDLQPHPVLGAQLLGSSLAKGNL